MEIETLLPAAVTFLAGTPLTELINLLTQETYEWAKKLAFKKDDTVKTEDLIKANIAVDLENYPENELFLKEIIELLKKNPALVNKIGKMEQKNSGFVGRDMNQFGNQNNY